MALVIYNTLKKEKEKFVPINEGEVKLYLCGPTVYNYLHIGNFRGPIFFNFVRNWLEFIGYKVNFVYNYTDVDDKIIKKAKEEGVESIEISERYIKKFEEDFKRLNLREHNSNPKVTNHIDDIINYVESLVIQKKAYVVEGEVFYSIDTFDSYGELSGHKLEDLIAGQRVEVDSRKKNPADFVLWKPAKEGEPFWDSPWGKGRPGWHIECSAMIKALLGETIDIHGGGIDLIFPHHENEIAQGEGCTGKKYVNYWMHNNFINMQGEKMSKSLGNIIPAKVFMDEYHPEVLKFLVLSSHYRSILNISDEKIEQTFAGLTRVYKSLKHADFIIKNGVTEEGATANKKFAQFLKECDQRILKSVNDDFATEKLISIIYEVIRSFNALSLEKKLKDKTSVQTAMSFISWIKNYGQMLALFEESPSSMLEEIKVLLLKLKKISKDEVEELLSQRIEARKVKDWDLADKLRDRLHEIGIDFQETEAGVEWGIKL